MKMFAKVYSDLDNSDIDNEVLLPPPKRIWDRSGRWASTLSAWRFASVLVLACLTVAVSILSFIALEHQLQHPFRVPELPAKEPCEHAIARPSWHTLPLHRRHGYKRAVERLTTLPSRLGLNTSLYDDFTYVHIQLVWQTHHTAVSLPYHRYFLSVFEETLRIDGGYDQPIPFWDWTLDADQPFASPVWDEFGGFGPAVSGCTAAKLANYSEHGYHPHCVQRTFNSSPEDGIMHSNRWTKDIVTDLIENSNTYDQFRGELERGVHKHLHLGIGGEMPTASSTNDPLFFLHHAQVDRIWWLWQHRAHDRRISDFSGPILSADGDLTEGEASLSDSVRMLGLAKDVVVRDIMRTDSRLLCYKYKGEL